MSDKSYLDFDILIEREGEGYRARVTQSPAGQAAAEFTLPFSDLEIENFNLRLGRSKGTARRVESSEMLAAKSFGGTLFSAVFGGEVRGCLRASSDEAGRQGAGLRVRLHLAGAPELGGLPWEYLYDPSLNRFLSLSTETPVVRYLDLPERVRPLTVKPPLRILAMAASPSDMPKLAVEREYENLSKALGGLVNQGSLEIERLAEPTLAGLQRRLRQAEYHVFHFIGHGGFDRQAEDGVLCFESEDGRARQVGSQYLGTLLHDHRTLRLAILNACEGGCSASCDPFSGTAQGLVQQGVPAVIAMQSEVSDEAAIIFSQEFYSAMAVGYPVDAALAEARKAIFAQVNELEWGTPVLFMRAPDGRIFDIQEISENDRLQARIGSLRREAAAAAAAADWGSATNAWQRLLEIAPDDPEAKQGLRHVREEQEAAARKAEPPRPTVPPSPPPGPGSLSELTTPVGPRPPAPTGTTHSAGKIVGLVLLTFLLFVMGVGLLMDSSEESPSATQSSGEEAGLVPASAPTSELSAPSEPSEQPADQPDEDQAASPAPDPDVQESLASALSEAQRIRLEACQTLDTSKLPSVLTGKALAGVLAYIESLSGQGVYAVALPAGGEIRSYTVSPDGSRAEVEVLEKNNEMRFLNRETNQCVARIPPFEVLVAHSLERGPEGWLLSSIQAHHAVPEPVTCEEGEGQ